VSTFLTYIFGLIVIGGVLFLLASFAFGRGEEMAPMPPPGVPVELPDGRPVVAEDVHALRLSVVLRGYRMEEVDWVLDALALELKDRDAIIADLRAELAESVGAEPMVGASVPAEPVAAEPLDADPVDAELLAVQPVTEADAPADQSAEPNEADKTDESAAVSGTARERVDG
jgi:DivIVA domain-containing protein